MLCGREVWRTLRQNSSKLVVLPYAQIICWIDNEIMTYCYKHSQCDLMITMHKSDLELDYDDFGYYDTDNDSTHRGNGCVSTYTVFVCT